MRKLYSASIFSLSHAFIPWPFGLRQEGEGERFIVGAFAGAKLHNIKGIISFYQIWYFL